MLEIAGGIVIAIAFLAALPLLLESAVWVAAIGIGLAAIVAAWLFLGTVVGQGAATATLLSVVAVWLLWVNAPSQERNARGFANAIAALPLVAASIAGGLAVVAAILFSIIAACMVVIGLFMWAFGPMGIVVGAVALIVLCFVAQRWRERRV